MKRRDFLKYAGVAAGAASFPLNGFSLNPLAKAPFLKALAEGGNPNGRVLVLIELTGGNDGLNTFIPLDQYNKLSNARPDLLIPENQTLSLSGSVSNALHPAMTELRNMYNDDLVSVVQNVGYPDQDYSHFRSMDIWMTASDSDEYLETGWLGRFLELEYPGFPTGYPNPDMPDPLAVEIGSLVSQSLMGPVLPMGFAINDPTAFYQFVNDIVEPTPNTPYGDELEYIRLITQQAEIYYDAIKNAADLGTNMSSMYPAQGVNPLADQLKVVAQLISGGMKTPIYIVKIGGFDTHSEQVDNANDPTNGFHSLLLSRVSEAIGAFQDDMIQQGLDDRVAGMTYSEFGRTIASNASLGTDHGAAAPMFVFGTNVIPGIIGDNPQIPDQVFGSEDIPMQHDFRSVYASALQDWFGIVNPEEVLNQQFPILPIFKAPSTGTHAQNGRALEGLSVFPNPFRQEATIKFTMPESSRISVVLIDINGRPIRTVIDNEYFPEGEHLVPVQRKDLPSGQYFFQVVAKGASMTKPLIAI